MFCAPCAAVLHEGLVVQQASSLIDFQLATEKLEFALRMAPNVVRAAGNKDLALNEILG